MENRSTESRFADLPATATHGPLRLEYRWLDCARTDAPIAVFLHEGLGSLAMWRNWPQTLCEAAGLRGLLYSRPGYGRSTPRPPHVKWPIEYMHHEAHAVLPELLDTLGVGADERARMWVIGHSDGASIALLYAGAFADALAGAVVIAPHVMVEQFSIDGIAQAKVAYEQGDLRTKLARYHDDVDSAFYGWNDAWLDPAFRQWDIGAALAQIRCPLLAVQGCDDEYGTMAHIDIIEAAAPQARIVRLPRCGHSPHRDVPRLLNREITRFIAEHSK